MEPASRLSFAPQSRLQKSVEFKKIFKHGRKVHGRNFKLYILDNGIGCARVGLAVPKRIIRTAVVRNRLKRIVRESFRHKKPQMQGVDVIVVATKKPDSMAKSCLRKQLDSLWSKVEIS